MMKSALLKTFDVLGKPAVPILLHEQDISGEGPWLLAAVLLRGSLLLLLLTASQRRPSP